MRAYISDIARHEGQQVTIDGWLHNRRSSGKIHFLIVRDGTGFIQAVMSKAAVGEDAFTSTDHLSQETSLSVTGTGRRPNLLAARSAKYSANARMSPGLSRSGGMTMGKTDRR